MTTGNTTTLDAERRIRAALSDMSSALSFSSSSPQASSSRRSNYLLRLRTYKASTWFAKPHPLTPMLCARHGWSNTGPDLLSCSRCGASLCFEVDPALPLAAAGALAERYRGQLLTGHGKGCVYAHVPDASTYEEVDEGECGADEVGRREEGVKGKAAGGFMAVVGEGIWGDLVRGREAEALAVCHWEAVGDEGRDEGEEEEEEEEGTNYFTVACKYCGVRGAVPIREEVREEDEEPPAKRGRWADLTVKTGEDDDLPPFDPLKAHRYFCPVTANGGEKGWRLCVKSLNAKA